MMRFAGRQQAKAANAERGSSATPVLKSAREIELMRDAGRIVHRVHEEMRKLVVPGVCGSDLGKAADEIIASAGAEALFRGVRTPSTRFPFPSAICASVNEVVVHGIPDDRPLEEGDIIAVDCGVRLKGYCGDAANTYAVGRISDEAERLLDVTKRTLDLAIAEMRPGRWWSEVASQMQALVESAGFSVVREFVGHGIGREMHEEPKVPNYSDHQQRKQDFLLEPGLVVAVEPMVNAGGRQVCAGDRTGWPQVTRDGRLSAHFEHTIAVTDSGVDILTDGR
ncbi:MAG TPA: type I methionyl aminopeptidase [Phycisphaerae bacterium]|nr:type I methionyl aminopeptidase [Phycisphaerae bacterium]HRW53267.1 type I methionyl aminopeptidase [Phycisphaerae bacterium]